MDNTELQKRIDDMEAEIAELKDLLATHRHDGVLTNHVTLTDLQLAFQTISSVPTDNPSNIYDQVRIYKSGATLRLYLYDTVNKAWRYTTLT